MYNRSGRFYIGGDVQTRQPIHRPQFEMTLQAMQAAKSNLLPLAMRMAGPREAGLHMIIGKNFGCTHFVIGHDHGSPGYDSLGKPFYPDDTASLAAGQASKELGIDIITFEEMVYLPFEDEFRLAGDVPESAEAISFTGTDIQKRIRAGKKVPDWASFPEVIEELQKTYPPPSKQGFTIFCTGLSGAGKSTIAECERRDRKGMYARARAGLLKGFTGVDDPYEDPPAPEIRIDTTTLTPEEAAQEVMLFISRRSFI